mmetsp:Transcript_7367/g.17965  ORF Transcript_7367/g.17965 Transcript_7367/m.17965 type:complete len:90 (-) Transcript_7367:70-339(-)
MASTFTVVMHRSRRSFALHAWWEGRVVGHVEEKVTCGLDEMAVEDDEVVAENANVEMPPGVRYENGDTRWWEWRREQRRRRRGWRRCLW